MEFNFPLTGRPLRRKSPFPECESDWRHLRADGFDSDDNILRTIRSVLNFDVGRLRDKNLSLQGLTDHARSILRFLIPTQLYLLKCNQSVSVSEAIELLKWFYETDRHERWAADNKQVDRRLKQSAEVCRLLGQSRSSRAWELIAHSTIRSI